MTRREARVTGPDNDRSEAFDRKSRYGLSATVCALGPTRPSDS